jgi:hypothetical protein
VAYINLDLPDATSPQVRRFVADRIDSLYLSDVHAMFRLPLPQHGIHAGLNFSIAQILMATISGISTTMYDHNGDPGVLFKGLVESYFPWNKERLSVSTEAAAGIIYDVFRNPLAHAVGLSMDLRDNNRYLVQSDSVEKVKRRLTEERTTGHTEEWLETLERSADRPELGPTLVVEPKRKVLLIEGLYWCVRRMIYNLASDEERMANAAQFLKTYT